MSFNNQKPQFDTPILPDEVYENLPDFFGRTSSLVGDSRRRDVHFLGMLSMTSGAIPNVSGAHDRDRLKSNLNLFVCAGAASGKGEMKIVGKIGEKLDKTLREENHEEAGKVKSKRKRCFLLPPNSSLIALVDQININNGLGYMHGTEADALGNSEENNWGEKSFVTRGAFHHETISISRKDSDIKIYDPSFSIGLAGTPGQLSRIIQNIEDGLFSRYIYYLFDREPIWRSQAPKGIESNIELEKMGVLFVAFALFWRDHKLDFRMTDDQWQKHTDFFSKRMNQNEMVDSLMRMGVICFRIAMIFTAVRCFESKKFVEFCSDQDFDNALRICEVLLEHTKEAYRYLSQNPYRRSDPFYKALPPKFRTSEAIEIGERMEMDERTVARRLSEYLDTNELTKVKKGTYYKGLQNMENVSKIV